jgi:hypothetical protein
MKAAGMKAANMKSGGDASPDGGIRLPGRAGRPETWGPSS